MDKLTAQRIIDKAYRQKLYEQYLEYYGVDETKLEEIITEHEEELQKLIDKMYVKIERLEKDEELKKENEELLEMLSRPIEIH